jgi:uncharacterized membrane protein
MLFLYRSIRNREGKIMEAETKVKEQAKKGAIMWYVASIICDFIGLFVIAGTFLGILGAVLGYYSVKQGSRLGYVGLVLGVIVFLLTISSNFL